MHSIGTIVKVKQDMMNKQKKLYLTIFTIANDEKYVGYANVVKALGAVCGKDYNPSENYHGS